MRDRAQTVDLGRYHEISAEDRNRRVDEVEVKQIPAFTKNAPDKNLQTSFQLIRMCR